jgi:hypothetical protein
VIGITRSAHELLTLPLRDVSVHGACAQLAPHAHNHCRS